MKRTCQLACCAPARPIILVKLSAEKLPLSSAQTKLVCALLHKLGKYSPSNSGETLVNYNAVIIIFQQQNSDTLSTMAAPSPVPRNTVFSKEWKTLSLISRSL
jgi:hypothetical protein